MLLILEILFMVMAWRKGWRAWALLPPGVVLFAGLLIGAAVGASGGDIENAAAVSVLLDLACLGVLIGMAVRPPSWVPRPSAPAAADESPVEHLRL